MAPFNLELGLSQSTSVASQAGAGDFVVTGGGGASRPLAVGPSASASSGMNTWLVAGIIGAALLLIFLVFKRH